MSAAGASAAAVSAINNQGGNIGAQSDRVVWIIAGVVAAIALLVWLKRGKK
jgi:tetrahydromethanopterin S-methyltransferase subunit F